MVSYYNHMAMYRQQSSVASQGQFHQSGSTSSWYPYPHTNPHNPHQQFFSCMQDNQENTQSVAPWHHGVFHSHQELFHEYGPHQMYRGNHQVIDTQETQLPSPPISGSELSSPGGVTGGSGSPGGQTRPGQVRSPYDWINKPSYQSQPNPEVGSINSTSLLLDYSSQPDCNGKTRTKDKYRVVYTDHQRLELEKEFHFSRYITIRRKAELAANLGLSERQVKIWFQNRRAKERKQVKKREEINQKDGVQCNSNNLPIDSRQFNSTVQQLHQQTILHHQQQQMNHLPVSLPLM